MRKRKREREREGEREKAGGGGIGGSKFQARFSSDARPSAARSQSNAKSTPLNNVSFAKIKKQERRVRRPSGRWEGGEGAPKPEQKRSGNKEKLRERGRKRSRKGCCCRHLGHGTHFASLISRKDSVRVTGVFRLPGAPGDPRLRSLLRSGI